MLPYILIAAFCGLACITLLAMGIGHALREADEEAAKLAHKAAAQKQVDEFLFDRRLEAELQNVSRQLSDRERNDWRR